MTKMPAEAQKLFTEAKTVAFATADAQGQPNTSIVGMKFIIDDETLYLSDQFFNKTLANGKANPKVSVAFWDGHDAYQIHGTARYVSEGAEFEAMREKVDGLFAQMGMPIKTKGGFYVHVDEVFNSAAGPEAGNKIA